MSQRTRGKRSPRNNDLNVSDTPLMEKAINSTEDPDGDGDIIQVESPKRNDTLTTEASGSYDKLTNEVSASNNANNDNLEEIDDLDAEQDDRDTEDGDMSMSTDFEEDDTAEWPASTIMHVPNAVDEKLVTYFQKYLTKPSNNGRIFKPSMTLPRDSEDDEESADAEEMIDETFQKCKIARDTQTLQKLYNMMEESIDTAVDQFIAKFQFFSIVSTKEEFRLLRFEPGDFYKEHVECSGLNDDSDGSCRRLCVYIVLEAPDKGGCFEFSYQGTKLTPQVGSLIIFPACPLHPLRITPVNSGNLMYVSNFML